MEREVTGCDPNERELIARCRAGDLGAFDKLILAHQGFAFSLAIRLLCDEDDARDAVQETFLRVWSQFERYDPSRKFKTWLYRIVSNVCVDRLRSRQRRGAVVVRLGEEEGPAGALSNWTDHGAVLSNKELCAIVARLTELLPEKQRLVFVLRDLQDLTLDEVCETTGMSRGTVKTNLHYARRHIRDLLERHYQVQGVS